MGTDRRNFLKLAGMASVAGVTGPDRALAAPLKTESDEWVGVLTDLTLCIGCRKCEWACEDANELAAGPIDAYDDKSVFDHPRRTDADHLTIVDRRTPSVGDADPVYVKTQCMHCNEPACASACLVAAFRKTPLGPVVYNEDVCIGCRYCMVACPFMIPAYSYDEPFTPAVRKCVLCIDKISEEGGVPACAKICPEEAISFGKRHDLIELAREKIRRNPERYVDHIYGEHEAGGTSWLYLSPVPFEQIGFRDDVGSTPYPQLTRSFLSSVPLVLTIWPAMLAGCYAFSKRRLVLEEEDELIALDTDEESAVETDSAPDTPDESEPSAPAAPNPGPPMQAHDARASTENWLTDKLFLGMPTGQYLRSLLTPANLLVAAILCVGLPVTWLRFTRGLAATTNLSDNYPWGLWIGFDVLCGVALAAGGYVVAATVYLFGLKEYRPLLRPAILTGFLGYLFVVIGLCYDLGRPWRLPYPMFVSYGVTSVMFLVGWHVALYLTVQFIEFCPAVFEWLGATRLRLWVARLTVGVTIFGVILSTLHQSALGALFLLAPGKVHPLWYSPFIPVFFFISSMVAGIAMVVVESALSHRVFHGQLADQDPARIDGLVLGLGKAASVLLFTYFCLKWIGVAHGQHWDLLNTPYGHWFLLEVLGFVLLPCCLFVVAVRRQAASLVRVAAAWTVLGIILNRLNVSVITFQWNQEDRYFPHWMEFVVTLTVVTTGVITFRWIVNRMPVLREHPQWRSAH